MVGKNEKRAEIEKAQIKATLEELRETKEEIRKKVRDKTDRVDGLHFDGARDYIIEKVDEQIRELEEDLEEDLEKTDEYWKEK